MLGKKNKGPDYMLKKQKDPEDSFLLRWWVIVTALLLVWPIGMILLITKIIGIVRANKKEKALSDGDMPFAKRKTKEEKLRYAALRGREKKRVVTTVLMTLLFLALACLGLTRDWLTVFLGGGLSGKLVTDFLSHALFALVGIYVASRGYEALVRRRRINRILASAGNAQSVPMDQLLRATGIPEEQLAADLVYMDERYYFGHGSGYDADARTLICWRQE